MEANIAVPAALIGDPARAAMLQALFDGRAQPATALAWAAGVSAQSASKLSRQRPTPVRSAVSRWPSMTSRIRASSVAGFLQER